MGNVRLRVAVLAVWALMLCAGCEQDVPDAPVGSCLPAAAHLAEVGCVEVRFAPSLEDAAHVCRPSQRFVAAKPCPRDGTTLLACNEQTMSATSVTALFYFDEAAPESRAGQHAMAAERCALLGGTQGELRGTSEAPRQGPESRRNEHVKGRAALHTLLARARELGAMSFRYWVTEPSERLVTQHVGALVGEREPRLAAVEESRPRSRP